MVASSRGGFRTASPRITLRASWQPVVIGTWMTRAGPRIPSRPFGRYGGRCRNRILAATWVGVWLLPVLAPIAAAQTSDRQPPSFTRTAEQPGEPEFIATVHEAREKVQRVTVPKNRAVLIETSIPCSRVDVVGKEIVRVEVATPTRLLVTGQAYGLTQVVLWTEAGQRHVLEVTVELDLELLNATIKDMDPQSDARAISIIGNVLLIGTVSSAEVAGHIAKLAELYTKRLTTGTVEIENQLRIAGEQQVLLKCVVAEISRSAVRELGINGFLAGENFGDGFLVSQIGGINPIDISPAGAVNVQNPIPFLTKNIPLLGAPLSLGFPDVQLQLFIQAKADNTLLRILAEPTLVAMSGETAQFRSGGEFPVPVPQSGATAGAITIEWKEFGVNLDFTPLVLPHQRIRIYVRPEVSARDEAGGLTTPSGFVPAITKREVSTTVEVASGSTFAIAGLLQDEIRGVATRIPGIGDLPVLGALFRSVAFQRSRTELVILVTPEIVAPMTPNQVPEIPGRRITDPDDLDLYLLGALEGREALYDIDLSPDADQAEMTRRSSWRSEPKRLSMHGPWGYTAPDKP